MPRTRIPYGVSNYAKLMAEDYYFVDKTKYIELLENLNEPVLFFLRPRKFGKSLFVSLLQHYYCIAHKEKFAHLFGETYIGKNPTPLANSYYVIVFDFSGINTQEPEKTYKGFTAHIKDAIRGFQNTYGILSDDAFYELMESEEPETITTRFFREFESQQLGGRLCILIDEYDHFANELISFRLEEFKNIVSHNGYVRKFYEVIKTATRNGIVDRFFATGVTPVTLDSMTSGFNIGKDLTIDFRFNEMLGFTEEETAILLSDFGIKSSEAMALKLKEYYNGSLFAIEGKERLYNSNLVLYFVSEYLSRNNEPAELIDGNIASDYAKIRNILHLTDEHEKAYDQIMQTGEVISGITLKYRFEREFNVYDFISLLFYNGLLTMKAPIGAEIVFQIPNYAIKTLYWEFFANELKSRYEVKYDISDVATAMRGLAYENNLKDWVGIVEDILGQLSNRDYIRFDEKYIKLLFFTLAVLSPVYAIKSEAEVLGEYPDLMYLSREPYKVNYQYLFELKYLSKAGKTKLGTLQKEAKEQVQRYLGKPEIRAIENLKAYTIIFVGKKAHIEEVNA